MRILYVTTISLTMNSFFKPHIEMLVNEGNKVDLACNYSELPLDAFYSELGCDFHHIDFSRKPLSVDNVKAYKQLKKVVADGKYDLVHCHTPNASIVTRLVCRTFRKKTNLKVYYTAHGFHFYKGAPKLNWMVFYPIEKFCSRFTDKLLTINQEDYALAKNKFKAKEVHRIPGIGVDLSKYENVQVNKKTKRHEIDVPEDAFLVLSVGEVNKNKNHQVIIRALAKLNNPKVHYAIAGRGGRTEYLQNLANKLGVLEQIHLLGYRTDIPELNYSADVFCFPSHREGLGLAAIEAMACGLPIITSNIHGINDYSVDGITGYKYAPDDVDGFTEGLQNCISGKFDLTSVKIENPKRAKEYELSRVKDIMRKIYDKT